MYEKTGCVKWEEGWVSEEGRNERREAGKEKKKKKRKRGRKNRGSG